MNKPVRFKLTCCSFPLITVFLLICPRILLGQISENEILSRIAENDLATARERVMQAQQESPNSAMLSFYSALLENDAIDAVPLYQNVIENFSASDYAIEALYRIAQHQFARGSYNRARELFIRLVEQNPQSPFASQSHYYAAKTLMIGGNVEQAKIELQEVIHKFPNSWAADFAREDLGYSSNTFQPQTVNSQPERESTEAADFAIQVGAFSSRRNAESYQSTLNQIGYNSEVVEKFRSGEKYFAVWIGSYSDHAEARKLGEELRRRYKINYHIVRRDE